MIKTCKDMCQDTYQPPPRLGAGRLCGLLADAGLLAADSLLWEPERQGGRARRRGDDGGQGSPKAAVFNQLLTTFLVVAMVLRLTVFWLCSKGDHRRGAAWPMMAGGPRPGCAAAAPGPGCSRQAGRQVLGGWVAEKGPALPRTGEEYCATSPSPLPRPWVAENCRGGFLESRAEIIWGPCWTFKISSFFAV